MVTKKTAAEPKKKSSFESVLKKYAETGQVAIGVNNELVDVISTGSLYLDIAIGVGGFPRGRVTELGGWEGAGKTTQCLRLVAGFQAKGYRGIYFDTEQAVSKDWANKIGADVNDPAKLLLVRPSTLEDGLELAQKAADSGEFDYMIFDSVAGVQERALDKSEDLTDSLMGKRALTMSKAMRKLPGALARNNMWAIFTNQLRESLNPYDPAPKGPGGKGLPFAASLRLAYKGKANAKNNEGATAIKVTVDINKNRLGPPFRQAEFTMDIQTGEIDILSEAADILLDSSYHEKLGINQRGMMYDLPNDLVSTEYIDEESKIPGVTSFKGGGAVKEMFYSDTEFTLDKIVPALRKKLIAFEDRGIHHDKSTSAKIGNDVAITPEDDDDED